MRKYTTTPQSERFWAKVDKSAGPDGCWLWTASVNNKGYGKLGGVRGGSQWVLAHRWAYANLAAPIPDGALVLHRCDVRACVNPAHLFLGTHKDNADDMNQKGRGNTEAARSVLVTHPERRAGLTKLKAIEIRRRRATGDTLKAIGESFGISLSTVWQIVHGLTWRAAE